MIGRGGYGARGLEGYEARVGTATEVWDADGGGEKQV
nr:MAG TPA: hypothetical protein [Caudoviricetes sp.]